MNTQPLTNIKNFCLVIAFYFLFLSPAAAQSWQALNYLPVQGKVDFITTHPANPNNLFIGAYGRLYSSLDSGKNWKELTSLGTRVRINHVYFADNEQIFLLTSEGVFESQNGGKSWTKNFSGLGKEQNALTLAQDPQHSNIFYLGTEGGVFKSENNGKTWQKETNDLARHAVRDLAADPENGEIFIASEKGLYRAIPRLDRLERVYTVQTSEVENTAEEIEEADFETVTKRDEISKVLVAPSFQNEIMMATTDGIYASDDEGNHWERFPMSGIGNTKALDLAYSQKTGTVFAATEKGVFALERETNRWKELTAGLPSSGVDQLQLISSNPEILYASTERGIYRIPITPEIFKLETPIEVPADRWNLLTELFRYEPPVRAIQKQAIRYANVSNWKTRRWQLSSRLRALVPSFSVGKGFSTSNNVDLDRGGTSEPDRFINGPWDANKSWDFDLNWNLSDLIWNSAQTSIDSRDKMMVELRNDILSEITRLYFERRRAQTEFILNPPEDPLETANALLRMDELTANIDSLTNGFLTKSLIDIYRQNPKFEKLWESEK
jgi:photosystem II stability/assembly factor-like uncharacterized protein